MKPPRKITALKKLELGPTDVDRLTLPARPGPPGHAPANFVASANLDRRRSDRTRSLLFRVIPPVWVTPVDLIVRIVPVPRTLRVYRLYRFCGLTSLVQAIAALSIAATGIFQPSIDRLGSGISQSQRLSGVPVRSMPAKLMRSAQSLTALRSSRAAYPRVGFCGGVKPNNQNNC